MGVVNSSTCCRIDVIRPRQTITCYRIHCVKCCSRHCASWLTGGLVAWPLRLILVFVRSSFAPLVENTRCTSLGIGVGGGICVTSVISTTRSNPVRFDRSNLSSQLIKSCRCEGYGGNKGAVAVRFELGPGHSDSRNGHSFQRESRG